MRKGQYPLNYQPFYNMQMQLSGNLIITTGYKNN
jgi:hypothetical protein